MQNLIGQHDWLELLDKLESMHTLTEAEWVALIDGRTPELSEELLKRARRTCDEVYGKRVFIRGLIELSSYCRNDCLYCGIRRGNKEAVRYRLSNESVLSCCEQGHELGFRTFVLQGGEDPYYTDDRVSELVGLIKKRYPDCAVTLSLGEKSRSSYQRFFDAGADRYLLRHETANEEHYSSLHPEGMSAAVRKQCLHNLRDIGYQVGSGFMVGSPGQDAKRLAEDMKFLESLNPHMVGIGPFIPHSKTPYANEPGGTLELTLFMIGCLRLMLPKTLLPSTTALASIHPQGHEMGMAAGANVIMPNLSPVEFREAYDLYEGKAHSGLEAAENLKAVINKLSAVGYEVVVDRGDSLVL